MTRPWDRRAFLGAAAAALVVKTASARGTMPEDELTPRTFTYKTVGRNGEQEEKKELSPAQCGERLLMELEKAIADPNITDEQKEKLRVVTYTPTPGARQGSAAKLLAACSAIAASGDPSSTTQAAQ